MLAVTGNSRQTDMKPVITQATKGSAANPQVSGPPQPATSAGDSRTQAHPVASRPGAQDRSRSEHRKRRGSISLPDWRTVTVSDGPAADLESNWPPDGKACPRAWNFLWALPRGKRILRAGREKSPPGLAGGRPQQQRDIVALHGGAGKSARARECGRDSRARLVNAGTCRKSLETVLCSRDC